MKNILLVGAGHAHIQVLHALSKISRESFKLTLISDTQLAPYSGMIPGYLMGIYSENDLCFNVQDICKKYNYQFIESEVIQINAASNKVQLANLEWVSYDICSLNLGIQPKTMSNDNFKYIYVKPISKFIKKWNELKTDKNNNAISIIGSGAAAFELAIACKVFNSQATVNVVAGKYQLLQNENTQIKNRATKALNKNNINLIAEVLDNEDTDLKNTICIVATSAKAPACINKSELLTDENSFLCVDEYLKLLNYNNIFAAGDCIDFNSKKLPKSGVFAVRQGPVLAHNIISLINSKNKLKVYRPQKYFLKILVSGYKRAIAIYGPLVIEGRFAWWLKNYIDLKFMKKFK